MGFHLLNPDVASVAIGEELPAILLRLRLSSFIFAVQR
jgi:hypothetical protein